MLTEENRTFWWIYKLTGSKSCHIRCVFRRLLEEQLAWPCIISEQEIWYLWGHERKILSLRMLFPKSSRIDMPTRRCKWTQEGSKFHRISHYSNTCHYPMYQTTSEDHFSITCFKNFQSTRSQAFDKSDLYTQKLFSGSFSYICMVYTL